MYHEGTVAELIVRQLVEWGIRQIHGVTGDALFPLMDALARHPEIRFVPFSMEVNAGYAASAHAKLTGEPGVAIAGSGPGAASLLAGLADAYADGAPVLALTGQVSTSELSAGSKQYFDQQLVMRGLSAYTRLVSQPGEALLLMAQAMRVAVERRSVAHLSLPKDILSATAKATTTPLPSPARPRAVVAGDLEYLRSQMINKVRPLILVGTQARRLRDDIVALASKWGAGVALSQIEKGSLPAASPLVLPGLGEAYLPSLLAETDCVLVVGRAPYEEGFLPQGASILRVGEDLAAVRGLGEAAWVTGDLQSILKCLINGLARHLSNQAWLDRIVAERNAHSATIAAEGAAPDAPVALQRLIASLSGTLAPDAVVTLDVGEFMHWFDRGFLAAEQIILGSSLWRGMGFGLPAAIAAKLARPERQVIALVGDGGFLMSLPELPTAVRLGAAITVIVVNNRTYALEKEKMLAERLTPFGVEVPVLDFAAFARAGGADGFHVETPAELDATLPAALNSGRVSVLDVITSDPRLPHPLAQPAARVMAAL